MLNARTLSLPSREPAAWEAALSRDEWEHWFARAPRPHFTQAWAYGEGKRAQGWNVQRLVFRDGLDVAALCQLLVKRPVGIPITRINRGPVFVHEHPSGETRLAVLAALRRRFRFGLNGLLLMAPSLAAAEESDALLRAAGFIRRRGRGWASSLIDLRLPPDTLFARLAPDWRTKIRRATKLGVTLNIRRDPEAFEWLLERHVENMRAKNFVGPAPEFVRQVTRAGADDFWLLQAMLDGRPEAGLLVGRFGQHAENFIAWFSDAARRATAGNFLMWHAVVEMQRMGCRTLDLGGFSVADRYGRFKRGMRGAEYRLAGEWLAF
jgi:lipid II:glycine glycyltransferase (peptidoglycan interpeptide bridge formation enzyme)